VLAVDFHQRRADRLERLHADRLVVDEGAAAAVGQLHAAQDHLAGIVEVVVIEDVRCRMALRHVEGRRHLALLRAVTHQPGIAAPAERQCEGVKQNRFAGAGFAGQYGQALCEFDIEPFDQDDVTDRKTGQHARLVLRSG